MYQTDPISNRKHFARGLCADAAETCSCLVEDFEVDIIVQDQSYWFYICICIYTFMYMYVYKHTRARHIWEHINPRLSPLVSGIFFRLAERHQLGLRICRSPWRLQELRRAGGGRRNLVGWPSELVLGDFKDFSWSILMGKTQDYKDKLQDLSRSSGHPGAAGGALRCQGGPAAVGALARRFGDVRIIK